MYRLQNISKRYKTRGHEVVALEIDDLQIASGESVAVVGPSGSGKTTLLSLLGGMLTPSSGEIWLDDQPLSRQSPTALAQLRCERIGFVFQTFNLVPYLTALENVQVPLALAGFASSEQAARAEKLLERVGLADRQHHKPSELSTGQQQRVALARTLANQPSVILADEPTGNLDPESRQQVLDFLAELHREGRTLIVVTHDPHVAQRTQRQILLNNGRIAGGESAATKAA